MPIQRKYLLRRDRPDSRDHIFGVHAPANATPVKLPPSVDLRDKMPPVYDQAELGSCTANAIGGLVEYLQTKGGMAPVVPSRLFIYYEERSLIGTINEDSGASLRDGIKVVANQGAPPETLWPYLTSNFAIRPTPDVYAAAAAHKISAYQRLNQTTSHLRMALFMGFPVVFGIQVYESFESDAVASAGAVPMPGRREQLLGGHAVMAVGYDMKSKVFICRNSWGNKWGQDGYFTLPMAYAVSSRLASDFWTAQISS